LRSAGPIQAVFYDFDGTLHADDPQQLDVFVEHAVRLGLAVSNEELLRAARWEYYYFGQSPELLADRRDFPDEQAFWSNYVRRQLTALGATADQAEALEAPMFEYMNLHYHPQDVVLPGVQEVLRELKDRGCVLGIVSNRDHRHDDALGRTGLQKFFDFWLWADTDGAPKPDKHMFERALRQAGVEAATAMHVGDNYFTDVLGSLSAGIHPVLLDPRGAFEQSDCAVIRNHGQILGLLPGGSQADGR
jgi:HAD superfamily hydrolase (TIGR01549 family)